MNIESEIEELPAGAVAKVRHLDGAVNFGRWSVLGVYSNPAEAQKAIDHYMGEV
jgi:hypothetical protein